MPAVQRRSQRGARRRIRGARAVLYTKRILSWNPFNPASTLENERSVIDLDAMQQTLSQNGYGVTQLADDAASVVALVRALRSSPGFVLVSTHGSPDGQLLTGSYVGTEWSTSDAMERFATEQRAIEAAGFGGMLSYRYEGQKPPTSRSRRPSGAGSVRRAPTSTAA